MITLHFQLKYWPFFHVTCYGEFYNILSLPLKRKLEKYRFQVAYCDSILNCLKFNKLMLPARSLLYAPPPPPPRHEAFFFLFPFKLCLHNRSVTSFFRGTLPPKKNPR